MITASALRLLSFGLLLLAASCGMPAAHAAERAEQVTAIPRPPTDKPYDSAAFDPDRVNEIEALGMELEERSALVRAAAKAAAEAAGSPVQKAEKAPLILHSPP